MPYLYRVILLCKNAEDDPRQTLRYLTNTQLYAHLERLAAGKSSDTFEEVTPSSLQFPNYFFRLLSSLYGIRQKILCHVQTAQGEHVCVRVLNRAVAKGKNARLAIGVGLSLLLLPLLALFSAIAGLLLLGNIPRLHRYHQAEKKMVPFQYNSSPLTPPSAAPRLSASQSSCVLLFSPNKGASLPCDEHEKVSVSQSSKPRL